jgi:hypothetical protein
MIHAPVQSNIHQKKKAVSQRLLLNAITPSLAVFHIPTGID